MKSGRGIELVLTSNEKVIGRLGAVEPDRFILKSVHGGGSDRELRFADIRAINAKMAIAGAVYDVLTVFSSHSGKVTGGNVAGGCCGRLR